MQRLLKNIGFSPKEEAINIYIKKYPKLNNYIIEVDFNQDRIDYGKSIVAESKSTQNFYNKENWVVLECVNRLLEKGYQPQNITLEKTWATGHGTSGRLDILVTNNDGSAYLMIECKTWGSEFDKELKNLEKNGGQLFTYFQQDKNAEIIMLYSSELDGDEIKFRNEIVKIEEDYRQTGNVKDLYERWNKLPKSNGVFDNWVSPYEFQSKALTKNDLQVLKQEDSSFIFNRFLEILRHNVVSDKPNAFNKIFTLFLCKIVDEYSKNDDDQLEFQWLEGEDNHIKFQKRLTDLYRRGMKELLEKKVSDVSDVEFDNRFQQVEERYRDEIKDILTEIRLKKNNEFAIKEVFDDASFQENAKVVKEVVELLQMYQIRYTYRQQFLSDFFELLLTTGLKQESGQFFTPVPIARFIIKSLPLQEIAQSKIAEGNRNDLLPTIIDYAAGSGHFITESMEEVQKYIDNLDESGFNPTTKKSIKKWKDDQFDWAEKYVYAIEKDYRLVKTAKVSCYLHGDGLAKVIHGDGLGDFATSTEFKDLLKETDKSYSQDNKQFDIIISNPPYSVSAFKGLMDEEKSKKGFELFSRLTDQSSEIECLFIERTKQLLKDGGVAGIILPSSILSNTGIYTQTREIILKYFYVLAIAEMGSNTFMATDTNTVTVFLKRRNNAEAYNIEEAIKKVFVNLQDITINGIEKPLQKYISHVWDTISIVDYKTLLQKTPNEKIKQHDIYKDYTKKIKAKNEQELWNSILALEQNKLLFFIIAYPQKLVLVKTGGKDAEKRFLGYEFSNRRGSEGIHPIQRRKSIDECTQLYDAENWENPEKASTYIYKAFNGEFDLEINENLKSNVSYQNLVDMLTFDRVDFEKSISLSAKKKVKFESKWDDEILDNLVSFQSGLWTGEKGALQKVKVLRNTNFKLNNGKLSYDDVAEIDVETRQLESRTLIYGDIILEKSGGSDTQAIGRVVFFDKKEGIYSYSNFCSRIRVNDNSKLNPIYLWVLLNKFYNLGGTIPLQNGVRLLNIDLTGYKRIKIPLPPKDIQEKIVSEIELLEQQEQKAVEGVNSLKEQIKNVIIQLESNNKVALENISENLDNLRKPVTKSARENGKFPYYGASGIVDYVSDYLIDDTVLLISEDGANLKSRVSPIAFTASGKIWVNNHAHILRFKDMSTHKLVELYINQTDISEFITGQAQPKLNQNNLNSIKIPLPPLTEQEKIVAEIEKIEKKIAEIEKQIELIPKKKEQILKEYLE
ncbi:MAG: restriction endonuclease subunit S [Spirochaetes bacterium]|nr:restriction endonuclease subunit S [Spirochaetota bacterium]